MLRKFALISCVVCLLFTFLPIKSDLAFGAEKPFIFGLLLVGPYNDRGYSQAHFEGGEYVQKKVPGTKMIYIDKVNPADRAAQNKNCKCSPQRRKER